MRNDLKRRHTHAILERACSRSNRSLSFRLLFCNHSMALLIEAFASCDSTTQSVEKASDHRRQPSTDFTPSLPANTQPRRTSVVVNSAASASFS